MIKRTVLDLNAGLGGRTYAFKKMGFEIAGVVDNDAENCRIINAWLPSVEIKNVDLLEVDPDVLPKADIITAKYMQRMAVENRFKMYRSRENVNDMIYKIIKRKNPEVFLLEVPAGSFSKGRVELEEYLQRFLCDGYKLSYTLYQEGKISGYPVVGKQGYIVGYRVHTEEEFRFPEERFDSFQKEPVWEDVKEIPMWYRKIEIRTEHCEQGSWYVREGSKIEKTGVIHMGYMRENYVVDYLGVRRFTHNELARLKGLDNYNYNICNNKRRMYNKIAYASNVYVVSAIIEEIMRFLKGEEKGDEVNQKKVEKRECAKKKKQKPEEVIFPKYRLKCIQIEKLKGINNLTLNFDKNLIALMGVNGSGKSTVLHALACTYGRYKNGDNYTFSYFFTPNPDASWKGSSLTVTNIDEKNRREVSKKYMKKDTKWANYSSRPKRDVHYMGISTGMPAIEVEKKTSFINYVSNREKSELDEKVIRDASYILNKNYDELMSHTLGKRQYIGVHTKGGIAYSALSMGAGEQRVIKILQIVHSAYQYSLILIDEIDLLLHADALKKLIKRLADIAKYRHLQIVFTTHALEMKDLGEYADVRYLEQQEGRTLVYDSIKPDLLYQLSGEDKREFTIYVEDEFAASVVKKLAYDMKMLRYISVVQFGSIENAFVVAAGKVLSGEDTDNILIVTDGDKYIGEKEKEKRMKSILTGTEIDHSDSVRKALSVITQFSLPVEMKPEEYVHEMLVELSDDDEIVLCAKSILAVEESHRWITGIGERLGLGKEVYARVVELAARNDKWNDYVKNVHRWIAQKKLEVNVISECDS